MMPTMQKWYEDRELMKAALDEYGSYAAAARAIGGASVSTVQKAASRLELERRPPGPPPKGVVNQEALERLHRRIYGHNGEA